MLEKIKLKEKKLEVPVGTEQDTSSLQFIIKTDVHLTQAF